MYKATHPVGLLLEYGGGGVDEDGVVVDDGLVPLLGVLSGGVEEEARGDRLSVGMGGMHE